ncbi:hypothetical protein DSO57_1016541 [Entomophthora muscae]|uniref:Uncharacterized protein n=1 Tax=Entomophthora muscae TaxID=34485 RepID=A0ACC2RJJ5_9FUNG|nr:hypothetical protein DSO57_1016541 [Entomophthora muscae]
MQTLSGYKFRYEFVKGELSILPDLLSRDPAMYPVCNDEDPLVTLIPASQVIPPPHHHQPRNILLTQVVGLCSLASPQQDIPLALPGTLLHDVLLAQRSSPDGMALLSKLTPEHPKEGAYTLKESIVYQNKQIWVPKSLCVLVMTDHHDPLCLGTQTQRNSWSSSGVPTVGSGSPSPSALGLSSVLPARIQNQIAQATMVSSTPSSRHRALGLPSW